VIEIQRDRERIVDKRRRGHDVHALLQARDKFCDRFGRERNGPASIPQGVGRFGNDQVRR